MTTKTKKKTPKKTWTRAQQRELNLFAELSQKHGYLFADSFRANDRRSGLMSRMENGKRVFFSTITVKLMVPSTSALGLEILRMRKEAQESRKRRA